MRQQGISYCEAVEPLRQVLAVKQTPTEIAERARVFGTVLTGRLQRALYDPEYVRHQNDCDGKRITSENYAGALSLLLADCSVGHINMTSEEPLPDILRLPDDDGVSDNFRAADIAIKLNSLAGTAIQWAEEAYGEEFAADVHTFFPDAGVPAVTPKPAESANS